jgi:predicted hotdog family 3-hydroxylacyl-ACP dehydratase
LLLADAIPASLSGGRTVVNYPQAAVMLIKDDELMELLPHKGKMLLISRIMEYDINRNTLCSEYDVSENCLFYDPSLNGVPAWMSFEFMAQAVSALSGLTGKILGRPAMIGFILIVSSYKLNIRLISPGESLRITVSGESRVGQVSTFSCAVYLKQLTSDALVSQAQLMLMDVDDPLVYLNKENYGNECG